MDNGSGWRKSSFSGTGNCVEIQMEAGTVHVRHTRDRSGAKLEFTLPEWVAFVQGVRAGEFDPPQSATS